MSAPRPPRRTPREPHTKARKRLLSESDRWLAEIDIALDDQPETDSDNGARPGGGVGA